MKNAAVADPAFELFSLVIGTMDDFTGTATNTEMVQSAVDPLVSYDQTSLMNMPKSGSFSLRNQMDWLMQIRHDAILYQFNSDH